MVTMFHENFVMPNPAVAPDGSVVFTFIDSDGDGNPSGDKHLFPMSKEAAEQLYKVLGEAIGKKIDLANMEDMKREVASAGVPKPQPRR